MSTTTQPGSAQLQVSDLTVRGARGTLLHGLDLEVAAGERVALLGASGAGKSLACSAVLGTLPPELAVTGSVGIRGRQVPLDGGPASRVGIGAVFQDSRTALNPLDSVGSQVRGALRRSGTPRARTADAAAELLRRLGFDDPDRILRSQPGELSGGQRQRACLALALACRPAVLLADEPTTALDSISQAEVLRSLEATTGPGADTALLLVTHDLAVASRLCQRAIVLADGRVVEQAPMRRLVHEPVHPFTRVLVEAARREAPWP